jgi:predicted acylesterase/phospholipase RssA
MSDGKDAAPLAEDEDDDKEIPLYLVLEGGGARGIAHVAVWRVLEGLVATPKQPDSKQVDTPLLNPRYCLKGVAGTSAGAIAAAFIAAGARSEDLIGRDGRLPLCDYLGLDYFHEVFGLDGWRRLSYSRRFVKPSKLLRRAAARLSPPDKKRADLTGERALAGLSPEAEQSNKLDPFSIFMLWAFGLFFGYQTVAAMGLLKTPTFRAILFILFWFFAYALFRFRTLGARWFDRAKRGQQQLRYQGMLRLALYPATSLVLALSAAAAVAFAMSHFHLSERLIPDPKITDVVLQPVLYGLCGALIAGTLIARLRSFFKGSISTTEIQDYIDRSLRAILTHRAQPWDSGKKCHEWEPKAPKDDRERRLFERIKDQPVTFGDMFDATGIQLHVVTADIIKNEVCVFSTERNRDYPVAKAVAASLAIPIAFRPVLDEHRFLVDGGIVSSIPAWVFRRDRTRDPDCRILAVEIIAEELDTWLPHFFKNRRNIIDKWRDVRLWKFHLGWIGRIIALWAEPFASLVWPLRFVLNVGSTASFGARALELDASDRLDSFPLRPNVGLLDFDLPREKAMSELERLENIAREKISNRLWLRKQSFDQACRKIEEMLRTRKAAGRERQSKARIRMMWAERDGHASAVRIKHAYGFDKDECDDRLVMPFGTSMTALAAETRLSQFAKVEVLNQMMGGRMNRYRRFVKWPKRKWCWAIPVCGSREKDAPVYGVLAIESDTPLDEFDRELGMAAAERSAAWIDASTGKIWKGDALKEVAEWRNNVVSLSSNKPSPGSHKQMEICEESFSTLVFHQFVGLWDGETPDVPTTPEPKVAGSNSAAVIAK